MADSEADAFLFLDADDWLEPDALARMIAALAWAPDAVGANGSFVHVPETARSGGPPRRGSSPTGGDLLPRLLERNLFANGGHLLLRRRVVAEAGGFRVGLAYGEDWEYWIRLALLGRFVAVPGRLPVLYVRRRASGAYLRMASDPGAFTACMDAIFSNASLVARFGPVLLNQTRCRAEAENAWIIGRELVRHGRSAAGLVWLRRSVRRQTSIRRVALLSMAHALPFLPERLTGPFRPYVR